MCGAACGATAGCCGVGLDTGRQIPRDWTSLWDKGWMEWGKGNISPCVGWGASALVRELHGAQWCGVSRRGLEFAMTGSSTIEVAVPACTKCHRHSSWLVACFDLGCRAQGCGVKDLAEVSGEQNRGVGRCCRMYGPPVPCWSAPKSLLV